MAVKVKILTLLRTVNGEDFRFLDGPETTGDDGGELTILAAVANAG